MKVYLPSVKRRITYAIIGFLAVFTSYIVLGLDLRGMFHFDYKFALYAPADFVFGLLKLIFEALYLKRIE